MKRALCTGETRSAGWYHGRCPCYGGVVPSIEAGQRVELPRELRSSFRPSTVPSGSIGEDLSKRVGGRRRHRPKAQRGGEGAKSLPRSGKSAAPGGVVRMRISQARERWGTASRCGQRTRSIPSKKLLAEVRAVATNIIWSASDSVYGRLRKWWGWRRGCGGRARTSVFRRRRKLVPA